MIKRLLIVAAASLLSWAAAAQTYDLEVRSNGAVVFKGKTDAKSISMRGDGYKDLGTFKMDTPIGPGPVDPPPPPPPPPPPGPTPTPSGGGLVLVTTQAAFTAAVQAALDGCYVAQLDGRSKVEVASLVTFNVKNCSHNPTGFDGNGMKIVSVKNDGTGVLKFSTSTESNRSLYVGGFALYGGGYEGKKSGDCVTLSAKKDRPIYKFTMRDIYVDYCSGHGMVINGDVFEGSVWNYQAENSNGSGLYMIHGEDCGIVSNVFVWGLNSSRNHRYGMELASRQGCGGVSSIHATFPSFISNGLGGILATGGIRNVVGGNCENSGQTCVEIGDSPYQTRIVGMEMSTDNNTKDPQSSNPQPMRYFIKYPESAAARVKQADNSIACYAWAPGITCAGVQLRAP